MKYYIDVLDKRNLYLKEKLLDLGRSVEDFDINKLNNMQSGDYLIFSPAKKFDIDFIKLLPKNICFVSGNISNDAKLVLIEKQIKHINLMEDEVFTVKNANLTCEGVLALMLEKSERSIYESNVLIIGGGRIAKYMALLLSKLGVKFSIVSYNPVKFPSYFMFTNSCYFKKSFMKDLDKFDIIINTIPNIVFDEGDIEKIAPKTIFIETASVNCLDKEKVQNFDYILAPALPTKFAPITASEYMFESIENMNNFKGENNE